MFVFLIVYLLGIIGFLIHYYHYLKPKKRTKAKTTELLLLYQLVFFVGITSFISYIALTFFGDIVQQYTNWPSCGYEEELANVNLAFGVLCMMAIWFRDLFWMAIVFGFSIWILGDALHHFYDAFVNGNYSWGNLGMLVYTDIFIPVLLLITFYFYQKYNRERLY